MPPSGGLSGRGPMDAALSRILMDSDEAPLRDCFMPAPDAPEPDAPGWTTAKLRQLVQESLDDPRPSIPAAEAFETLKARIRERANFRV